jgi:site-specific DNA-methyltransferase (adenine-specific)
MMAEKVTIGNCELWHGDCREVLPLLQGVDAIVSDPPYGIAYQHSGGGKAAPGAKLPPVRNAKMPIANDAAAFDPTHLLGFESVLIFGADHYRDKLPAGGTLVAWDKSCGIGPADSFADAEFAWTNARVKRNVLRYLWKGVACEKAGEENGKRYHPTQKPIGVMQRCIELLPAAAVICDPYMGSGSTGVAALRIGRRFIGIECDRRYFDVACERIENEQRQCRLAV